jgi:hypothetical protein
LRAAYAEGATIVTNEQNKNFYERVILVPQPRTLSPDRLSMTPFATTGPGPGKLETYRERHAISDGDQSIISYHLEGFNHAQDMAIVYLPKAKILINADMGPPPAGGTGSPDQRQFDCAVQQHQAAEARCDAARANPRQPEFASRFRTHRWSGRGSGSSGRRRRWRRLEHFRKLHP